MVAGGGWRVRTGKNNLNFVAVRTSLVILLFELVLQAVLGKLVYIPRLLTV